MRLICLFLLLGMLLWPMASLRALDPGKETYQFRKDTWKTGSGLPVNSILCVRQTGDGYLWLGTHKGLVRFDGVRFRVFDKKTAKNFLNNVVRVLYPDPEGNLWIGTEGGLLKYSNGCFTSYSSRDGLPHRIIRDIILDGGGTLWVATYGGGVFSIKNGVFTTYTSREGLSGDMVRTIFEDSRGILRVGTENGLSRFANGKFEEDPLQKKMSTKSVTVIFEDHNKVLWIGTTEGLYKMDGDKLSLLTTANGLAHNIILSLVQDNAGNLWIGTDGGLNRITNGKLTDFSDENGFPGNIYTISEDREGSLWIGTRDGLSRLKDVSFTTFTERSGLSNNMVTCVVEDNAGTLWVGTGNGLNRLENGTFSRYTSKDGLSSNHIASFLTDREGCLWVGTAKGVNCFKNGKFLTYSTEDGLSSNKVSAIYQDKKGVFWFGTYDGGLNSYDGSNFKSFRTKDGLSHNWVTCIAEDPAGDLWIGTNSGLNRLRNGKFSRYTKAEGLSHNCIGSIFWDNDETLWIGTDNGPNRYKDGIFTAFNSHQEQLGNEVLAILEDNYGYLWMSSHKGIYRAAKKDLNDFAMDKITGFHVDHYDEFDGMKSRLCNGGTQPAGCKRKDGTLWFPTIKGVVMVEPGKIMRNTLPPPLSLEEIKVNGEEIKPAAFMGEQVMTFDPGVKQLEFHYTGLSFLRPEKVKFKFRLEGYEEQWVEAGDRRTAYYTNLAPGHYTFRVNACNNDGTWNQAGAAYKFYLAPYFYQTTWFYVLCCFIVAALAFGGYKWRLGKLEKRKKELEELVDKRTRQLKITNRKLSETNLELKKIASMDTLTDIHNYRWFSEFLELEWRRAFRNKKSVSLFVIDVDCYKAYNEAYGHEKGDKTLKVIGQALKGECRRPGDIVARYGGEEFIALFADTSSKEAVLVAERLHACILSLKIPHEKSDISDYVTISLGGASLVPGKKDSSEHLIQLATKALARAKKEGRNGFALQK